MGAFYLWSYVRWKIRQHPGYLEYFEELQAKGPVKANLEVNFEAPKTKVSEAERM
jgi:hypothetical protein